jgi:hypothetical protein
VKSLRNIIAAVGVAFFLQDAAQADDLHPLPEQYRDAIAQMKEVTFFQIEQHEAKALHDAALENVLDCYYDPGTGIKSDFTVEEKISYWDENRKRFALTNKAYQDFLHSDHVKSKVLSEEQTRALGKLLLDPAKYYYGEFSVQPKGNGVVEFTLQNEVVTIVLGWVVIVIQGDQMHGRLLNDVGLKELKKWIVSAEAVKP